MPARILGASVRRLPWRRQLCRQLAEAAFVLIRSHCERFGPYLLKRMLEPRLVAEVTFVRARSHSGHFRPHVWQAG